MSWAPRRPCPEPLCPATLAPDQRRCPVHGREARRQRAADSGDAWYSSRPWRRLRALKLSLTPLCEVSDCRQPATQVDHRLDRRTHPHLELVLDNLTSLCASHHSAKTARTRSGWAER